jgi:hypothetical protein
MALQRTLFRASSAAQRSTSGQSGRRPTSSGSILTRQERAAPRVERPRSSPSSFYFIHGRAYTREELLVRAEFDRWCREMPGERLAVLLVISPTSANVRIVAVDPPQGDLPAWWRHGDIIALNIAPPESPNAAAALSQESP